LPQLHRAGHLAQGPVHQSTNTKSIITESSTPELGVRNTKSINTRALELTAA